MVRYISLFIIIGTCLSGCAPTTQITASWKNPEMGGKSYNSVMVAALTQNLRAKQTVENDLAAALSAIGVEVGESSEAFAPNFTDDQMQDKEELLKGIRQDQYDGILTVSLIDKESESHYVQGSHGYVPVTRYIWYGNFWGYYTTMYPSIYQPGYYIEEKTYFMETNLYDATSEKLVWSAQSRSYNPSDLERFSEEFAELMVQELQKEVDLGR